ncbi:MAG: hypothetical protein Kow0099_06140 [Candidatus Abyssubacteria bacterium]
MSEAFTNIGVKRKKGAKGKKEIQEKRAGMNSFAHPEHHTKVEARPLNDFAPWYLE